MGGRLRLVVLDSGKYGILTTQGYCTVSQLKFRESETVMSDSPSHVQCSFEGSMSLMKFFFFFGWGGGQISSSVMHVIDCFDCQKKHNT
jgi:hypothetical protein